MGSTLLTGLWTILLSVSQLLQWLGTHWSAHDPRQMCYQTAAHGVAAEAQDESVGLNVCVHACPAQCTELAAEVPALQGHLEDAPPSTCLSSS